MTEAIVPVSYQLAKRDPKAFVKHFAGSFERYGFAVVNDHELPQALIDGCLDRNGRWLPINPPAGSLVCDVGDMLQRLINHVLPSTTHRVVNPTGARVNRPRYSMPFFLHFNSDFPIATLPGCIAPERPNRNPKPILAHDYLRERLREFKLLY